MTLDFQVAKRQFKNVTGIKYLARITIVNGSIKDSNGRIWVTPLGSSANTDETIQNSPIALRERPGTNKILREGRTVIVAQGFDGLDEVVGNDPNDLEDSGIPISQLNATDEKKRFNLIEDLINGSSFPSSSADLNVTVNGTIYQKSDGTYDLYNGEVLDLASYVPATSNMQVIACIWLNPDTNSASVTTSSEVAQTTNLRLPSNNQTTIGLINECQTSAPSGALGTWSYVLKNGDTKTTLQNKLWDIRGIYGAGGGEKYGNQKVISSAVSISSGYQGLLKGELQIEAGGSFTIAAGGEMVIL